MISLIYFFPSFQKGREYLSQLVAESITPGPVLLVSSCPQVAKFLSYCVMEYNLRIKRERLKYNRLSGDKTYVLQDKRLLDVYE